MSIISLQDISFAYHEQVILDHLTLSIHQGERVGLVGTSGCGKSTLLKLVAGLYPVIKGNLTIMGENSLEKIRPHIAMVMQNPMLFPTTIKENITCGHPLKDEVIRSACEAAQLMEWIQTLPEGLDTFVGERGNCVSGGQGQRICIARAIAKDAHIILLDEATSALDGEVENAVLAAMHHLMAGKTVISATHRVEALEGFDAIYRMERGKLMYVSN